MTKESKYVILGKLIGNITGLISMYYCSSRVTHALLSKDTPSDVFVILNVAATVLYFSVNNIGCELIKIRKFIRGDK